MHLQRLRLENYRGYNEATEIPLDGRVLLFYGQNGRGKSSVFGALELALFPEEKIRELRREYGANEVPLTNRFNDSPVGTVQLWVENGGETLLTQQVRDQLEEMTPALLPLHRRLGGQRRRIFFTQELLRDVMLGSPTIRYRRLSEMLGCDAYDRLIETIRQWAEGRGLQVREQVHQLEVMDDLRSGIADFLKERGLEPLVAGLLERQFQPNSGAWFARALLDNWRNADPELGGFLAERVQLQPTQAFARTATRILSDLQRQLTHLALLDATDLQPNEKIPGPWRDQLLTLRREAADARSLSDGQWRKALIRAMTKAQGSDGDDGANQAAMALKQAQELMRAAEEAWNDAVRDLQGRVRLALDQAAVAEYVVARLTYIQDRAKDLAGSLPDNREQLASLVARRRSILHGLRYLYDALIDLTHNQLGLRLETLKPLWKQHYGQISSHAHFQDVDMEVRSNHILEDPLTAFWSPPYQGRTVRFLVSDPEAKKKSKVGLPMQALLSEGQLNCAVVALALALSDVQAPPMKLIALDDPFVSWDDVNMENFLAAIRDLAWKHWTVMLSTCDERVVTSFRKNMETLGEEFPGITYTFRDWDRAHGPRVDFARLPLRQTKNLRDLPPEVCEFETLQSPGAEVREYEADIWIVPLSDDLIQPGHSLSYRDIPFVLQKYYYPASSRRRLRTKYIGFRFDGRLQAYAQIAGTRTIPNFDDEIPGLTVAWAAQPHVVVELAELKRWPHTLRSGPLRDRHAYCDLDLMEQSESVMEADRLSAERRRLKQR